MTSMQYVLDEIAAIRSEDNIDKRLCMLHNLNESLPEEKKLRFPSLITGTYIRRALDTIEEDLGHTGLSISPP